jgi:hypothetical protein
MLQYHAEEITNPNCAKCTVDGLQHVSNAGTRCGKDDYKIESTRGASLSSNNNNLKKKKYVIGNMIFHQVPELFKIFHNVQWFSTHFSS